MTDLERATFRASLPPIMSAIKAGGDGMRVQFDIPESDMAEAIKLMQWRNRILIVTVEPEPPKEQRVDYGL
jgi:hypothetical protein